MKRKWKACLCIAAFLLAVLPVSASADSGPKPQITIQMQNAPDGDYYVDLLIPGEVPERCIDNIEWNHIDRASLPLDALERDRMDGWHYAMLAGRHTTASVLQASGQGHVCVQLFRHAGHVSDCGL